MAKQSNSYAKAPWVMKPKEFEKFTLVTPDNLANAKKLGRVFYSIYNDGGQIQYCGSFIIFPQMQKGMMRVTDHPFIEFKSDIFIHEDEPVESYAQSYKSVINHLVAKKRLYININDPIVKFFKV